MKKFLSFWPIGILFFVNLIFFYQVLFQGNIFVTPALGLGDITKGYLPYTFSVAQAVKLGRFPFWTDQISLGLPFAADPSTLVFFPLATLFIFLFPTALSYSLNIAAYFFIAGFCLYLYSRSIKISKSGALFAAIAFSFSGYFTTRIMHIPLLSVVMLFPAQLYYIEKLFQSRKLRYAISFALILALQIFASYPQVTLYSLLGSSIYFLFKLFFFISNTKDRLRLSLYYIFSVIIGILIAAVQIIPTIEFLNFSERASGLNTEFITFYAYHFEELITLIFPYIFGNPFFHTYNPPFVDKGIFWENTAYVGVTTLLFAALSFFNRKKDRYFFFFLFLLIVSFLISFGKYSPLAPFLFLPPFNFFRIPSRALFLAVVSLAIFAGYGFDYLMQKFKKIASILSILAFSLLVIDLYIFCFQFNVVYNASDWLKTPKTAEYLQKDRSFFRVYTIHTFSPQGIDFYARTLIESGGWGHLSSFKQVINSLDSNINVLYNIKTVKGYSANPIIRSKNFLNLIDQGVTESKDGRIQINDTSLKLLRLISAKYITTPAEIENKNVDHKMSTSSEEKPVFHVYETKNVLPHAFIVENAKIIQDNQKLLDEIKKPEFDPSQTVFLEKGSQIATHEKSMSMVLIENNTNTTIDIKTISTAPSFLVLSDTYYPGWHSYVDGSETEILRADYVLRAIKLPAGNHRVKFQYIPELFKIGAIISTVTVLLLITMSIFLKVNWISF